MRIAALLVVVVVVLAGCAAGGDPAVVSGTPATVGDDALSSTGFERVAAGNRTLNATVRASISGDVQLHGKQSVRATTPVRVYRDGDAVFAVVSAPAVRPIENKPTYRDPLATRSPAEQVAYAQSVYAVTDLRETGTDSVAVLGNETTLRTYDGRTDDGTPVVVTVARVRHGGDFVTGVAVTPATDTRRDDVVTLLEGIRHAGDA
ncbi:MAG: DUF6517 family protein [Haloferacaceae archaeon]